MAEAPCELPRELKACCTKFSLWYKNSNSNKNLNWAYSNGSVELHMIYTAKRYQLTLNVFQASILCLFNFQDEITCRQIKELTNMPVENFKAAMMRLCDPKVKVLLKKVNKPVFGEDEPIKCNPKFSSNAIKQNLIPQRTLKRKTAEASEEEQKQANQVKKERTFVIQAHIVKVMKA